MTAPGRCEATDRTARCVFDKGHEVDPLGPSQHQYDYQHVGTTRLQRCPACGSHSMHTDDCPQPRDGRSTEEAPDAS